MADGGAIKVENSGGVEEVGFREKALEGEVFLEVVLVIVVAVIGCSRGRF